MIQFKKRACLSPGFTLIELLVVVLIIGILSAVAVPQYQNAVDKARLMNLVQMAVNIRKAEEVYYLANGRYVSNLHDLDVDYTQACSIRTDTSILDCPNAVFDNISGSETLDGSKSGSHQIAIHYCPGRTAAECLANRSVTYSVYFSVSNRPNEMVCSGLDERGTKLCKTFKF